MLGYWGRPEATSKILRDGWLYTGDLGHLDEDGYLTIVDRKKDVIKPSGFQVWPREVEEVIAKHPAVAEVGVIGVPDPARARRSRRSSCCAKVRPPRPTRSGSSARRR